MCKLKGSLGRQENHKGKSTEGKEETEVGDTLEEVGEGP